MSWFVYALLLDSARANPAPPPDPTAGETVPGDETPAPPDDLPPTDAEPILRSLPSLLSEAKSLYFLGRNEEALELLELFIVRLDAGEEVDWPLVAECFVYAGEIRHLLGRDADARAAFRRVLLQDPDHPINPYHHPMEVIGLYETVRRQVKAELASQRNPVPQPQPTAPVRRPLPLWGVLPFGAPQFGLKQRGRGIAYASLQAGFGIGSIVTLQVLSDLNQDPPWPDVEERTGRLQRLKYGVQWPLTAAFYLTWGISIGDAATHWRRSLRNREIRVGITPAAGAPDAPPGGGMLLVTGKL